VFQYYYGVDPVDVLPTRPLYGPDGGTIAEFGVAAMYPFGKRHALRFQIEMELLPNQVRDSPIVVRDNVVEVGIGYFFLF
jgi:outer membrane scaffolding protein for murein synthesis (MipA/OmpV family)